MINLKFAILIICCYGLGGCTPTQTHLYQWGRYEGLIYDMYNKPGKAPPEEQILQLSEDIEKAESAGKQVPPGIHAHMGMMYANVGNLPAAEAAFNNEKRLYPESAIMIDGMLQRALNLRNKNTPAALPLPNPAKTKGVKQ